MKRIKVIIDPVGKATVEAEGFSGNACVDATRAIEAALGGNVERVEKPEFFEDAETTQEIEQTW